MSLGWQTESTLLPRKAKPIHVDDGGKSMLSLRAVMANMESTLAKKKESVQDKITHSRKRMHSITYDQSSTKKSHNQSDDANDEATKVYNSLNQKAKLYDEMTKANQKKINSDHDNKKEIYLVNFEKKTDTCIDKGSFHEDDIKSLRVVYNNNNNTETSNSINMNSQSSSVYPPSKDTDNLNTSSSSSSSSSSYQNEKIIISESSSSAPHNDDVPRTSSSSSYDSSSSSSSFSNPVVLTSYVKSQWEKDSNAKGYLNQIHEETILNRETALANKINNNNNNNNKTVVTSSQSTCTSNDLSTSQTTSGHHHTNTNTTSTTSHRSSKDLRREMLLMKQKQFVNS